MIFKCIYKQILQYVPAPVEMDKKRKKKIRIKFDSISLKKLDQS